MRNFIRSKKLDVGGGGCFRIRMSNGSGDFTHKVVFWQTLSLQHSLSAQSTKPSVFVCVAKKTVKRKKSSGE